jgi:hypothetical protein
VKLLIDIICTACKQEFIDRWVTDKEYPTCDSCGGPTERLWKSSTGGVLSDDIPGGVLIEHGLCAADGSPKRYYSKSEIARAARERGLIPFVRHQASEKGSDKSPNTSRWI